MKRDNYYNYIDEQLHILAHRIISNGKLNILRLHLHSENFYLHFFNLLYGYNLINLNDVSQNIEAIDLIDHDKKIMIQVSSTSTKQKIESALSKNILKEYAGYRFKFISIAKDASDLRKKEYKNPHAVTFNPSEDIYDIHSLLNTILSLDLDKLKEVYNFIQKELGEESKNRFDSTILKEKYLNNFKTISLLANDKKPIDDIFINLTIIKEEEKKKDNPKLINREPILNSYEEIHKPKEPIAIEELINISKKSLIYGKAGIGKTTLCKYIAYKWAKEELYQEFEYVIYIALREWKTKGLKGAIKDNYYSQDEEKITLDIKANNSKMLFLFDGYDELEGDKKKILRDEIEHYNLNHYIITTRPYGYQKSDFRVDEYFETIGFTDKDVEKYIDAFFRENNDKAKSLKAYLETNINIKHIGYIPLMLEMICSQWEQKEFSESLTMTELYSQVVEDILNRYSAQKDDKRVYKRKNRKKIKEQLGKLAFRGLTKQTILFDGDFIENSVDDIFFEENVIYSGFLKSDAKEKDLLDNCFEFLHLTFQEYFSALYVSTLSKEEQSKIIRDWKFYPHMQMFFAFLGGLIGDKEFLLSEIESEPIDIIGFYEFTLILICSSEMNKVAESRKEILFQQFDDWLSLIILNELENKTILDNLKFFSSFMNDSFLNNLLKIVKNKKIDKYIRTEISDKMVFLTLSFDKFILSLLSIIKDDEEEVNTRGIIASSISKNKDSIPQIDLSWIDNSLWNEFEADNNFNLFDFYNKEIEKIMKYLMLNNKKKDPISSSKPTADELREYDIKVENSEQLFLNYNKNDNLEIIIMNSFYNLKPLYIKNRKLHTIENGKEISTQREVDEATLNEIKMMFRGEGLNG